MYIGCSFIFAYVITIDSIICGDLQIHNLNWGAVMCALNCFHLNTKYGD